MIYTIILILGVSIIFIRALPLFNEMQIHSDPDSLQNAFHNELLKKDDEYTNLKNRYDELINRVQVEKQLSYEAGYNKAIYQQHNLNVNQKMSSSVEKRC